jgi:phosphonate transport system ATP-binding protein
MGNTIFQAQGVVKNFGPIKAVDDVSFVVKKPEMLGIIGRSGAGKSTLLRVINRLTDATSGAITYGDQELLKLHGSDKRAWQARCAMIFQQFNLVPRMDVVSNVLFGTLNTRSTFASLLNLFPRSDINRAIDILERLGVAENCTKRAEALSGGQQQRVAIARALMQNPEIILADEPIASLDPLNAKIVMESLRRIHDEDGRLVICNLHTLDTARAFCDRIIGMRDGKIVFDGSASDLSASVARDVYGADQEFSEAATSTSIETLETVNRAVLKTV